MSRIASLLFVVAAACGGERRGQPVAAPAPLATAAHDTSQGEALFRRFCFQCHPNGEGGLGPALNDKPLPEPAIRTQIRKGVGAMPKFGHEWLNDADVAAIADYVHALHDAPAIATR